VHTLNIRHTLVTKVGAAMLDKVCMLIMDPISDDSANINNA
jgi:hypothetical protein